LAWSKPTALRESFSADKRAVVAHLGQGMPPRNRLGDYVYTYEAASQAAAVFSDCCRLELSNLGDATQVILTPLLDAPTNIAQEYLNYVLGLSVEHILKQV
jgi:hypothetical protein